MHFHLPKPLHGWREFAGEVGIIVLGVLIALTAEQVVEALHWRSEVSDFRTAVRAEMSYDLATDDYRRAESPCVIRRLDELQRWIDAWRTGRRLKLSGPIGWPTSLIVNTNVWQSRDAATVAHMTLNEKLEYAYIYNEFANNEAHRLDERAAWLELADFDGATELDHHDQMRLQGLITRARLRDERMNGNAVRFMKRAARMGIRPKPDPNWPKRDPQLCKPVLPPSDEAGAGRSVAVGTR